jgi:hypothetical protein
LNGWLQVASQGARSTKAPCPVVIMMLGMKWYIYLNDMFVTSVLLMPSPYVPREKKIFKQFLGETLLHK